MVPRLPAFSPEEIDEIHRATMALLAKSGVVLHDPNAVDVFQKAGCKVEGSTVFPDERLVEKALGTAPSGFSLQGTNPKKAVYIGSGPPVFAPGYGVPFIAEQNGDTKPATMKDYNRFCKLIHTSTYLDMNGFFMVSPQDVPAEKAQMEMMRSNLILTDRPFLCSPADEAGARGSLEMAAMVFGSRQALEKNPPMMCLISPLSPLQYTGEMARSLMAHAKAGIPVVAASAAISGASGPITCAGILTLQNAELLTGLMLTQLVRPKTPFVYGGASAAMDMRTGAMMAGAPETARLTFGTAQMARRYNLPCRSGGGLTDAFSPDAQAGYESAMLLLSAALSGVDFVLHAAGIVGTYIAMSFEKFIMDEDMCGMVKNLILPQKADKKAIDLDALSAAGPGGNFLTSEQTVALCRTAFFTPAVFTKGDHANWLAKGRPSPFQTASKEIERRLSQYQKPDLPPSILRDLKAYVQKN